jgi:poly-gamma-glutamate synthesis protein (capsule biosynthesis protein)
MEWYKGRPIMYGLGHFVFDVRLKWGEEEFKKKFLEWDPAGNWTQAPYAIAPRNGWPLLPMHEDTRMTLLAWATAGKDGVSDIGFLPCRLTADGLVHPLKLGSPESNAVVSYLEECNRTQGLKSRIVPEGSTLIAGVHTLRVVLG